MLAVDAACFRVVGEKLHVLIGKTPAHSPYPGEWALLGGMIRPEETAEKAVQRMLLDKAGISDIYTEQVHTFSRIDRDPRGRVVSLAYMGLTYIDPQDLSKARLETKWVPIGDVPKLAYDHDEILGWVFKELQLKTQSLSSLKHLLPEEFTLSELQNAYEIVVGERVDKRNFRKRVLNSGLLRDLKRKKKTGVMRPAALFKFK